MIEKDLVREIERRGGGWGSHYYTLKRKGRGDRRYELVWEKYEAGEEQFHNC